MGFLERELATYREHLSSLLANEGKYVVIKGEDFILSPFDTYDQALAAGYERFGPDPFLVKQIRQHEPIMHFTRDLPRWDTSRAP